MAWNQGAVNVGMGGGINVLQPYIQNQNNQDYQVGRGLVDPKTGQLKRQPQTPFEAAGAADAVKAWEASSKSGLIQTAIQSGPNVDRLRTGFMDDLLKQLVDPGYGKDTINRMINEGTDELSANQQDTTRSLRQRMAAMGFGGSGAELAGETQLATQYGGKKANLARDIRTDAAKTALAAEQSATGQAGSYLGEVDRSKQAMLGMLLGQNADVSGLTAMAGTPVMNAWQQEGGGFVQNRGGNVANNVNNFNAGNPQGNFNFPQAPAAPAPAPQAAPQPAPQAPPQAPVQVQKPQAPQVDMTPQARLAGFGTGIAGAAVQGGSKAPQGLYGVGESMARAGGSAAVPKRGPSEMPYGADKSTGGTVQQVPMGTKPTNGEPYQVQPNTTNDPNVATAWGYLNQAIRNGWTGGKKQPAPAGAGFGGASTYSMGSGGY